MRTLTLAFAATAMAVPVMTLPAAPAEAQSRFYDRNGNYVGPTWRGRNGRYYCRKSDGTTGLLIGGAAGAVIGNQIAGGTLGPVVGGIVGAIAGREVDRQESGYRDRRGRRCR